MPESSVDALVTDPPYGWRFMGKAWDVFDIEKVSKQAGDANRPPKMMADGRIRQPKVLVAEAAGKYDQSLEGNLVFQSWTEEWARAAYRVLKPGAHMLVFCGPRTYHRMASGVEDAGFEVRDEICWLFGSGFPKSLSLKNIGKPEMGTALKPAHENILLARKPLSEKTVAANVLKYGTGGINIDGCRIGALDAPEGRERHGGGNPTVYGKYDQNVKTIQPAGRFPANLVLSHNPDCVEVCTPGCAVAMLDGSGNTAGPSRFFYVAKASKSERNKGLDKPSCHPTVKPLRLMRYLIRLVCQPGGIILDPFMGSGSTGVAALQEGFQFIGIEKEKEYLEIAEKRIAHAMLTAEEKLEELQLQL